MTTSLPFGPSSQWQTFNDEKRRRSLKLDIK